jgi:hypothetical protein
VLRRWVEIPLKINGYAVQGARAKLDLRFDFNWNNKGPGHDRSILERVAGVARR